VKAEGWPNERSPIDQRLSTTFIPLKLDELSDILGLSPQEVELALIDLESQGIIRWAEEGFLVLDWPRLREWGGAEKV
jgi:hypothetical protein